MCSRSMLNVFEACKEGSARKGEEIIGIERGLMMKHLMGP